ncbi:hypothetical protein BV22DRAFT_501267 [Leucogyrophana mollusca]|uniref:Uncharacterized protein n=1 Tax=Leucogyrophana mollusca TaxID=85980 RepID=A0ACB8BG82_9AGAM|nr:hypothetical protein BV22DRAFT_501267 [Leucogyrophana mollusca]
MLEAHPFSPVSMSLFRPSLFHPRQPPFSVSFVDLTPHHVGDSTPLPHVGPPIPSQSRVPPFGCLGPHGPRSSYHPPANVKIQRAENDVLKRSIGPLE